MALGPRDRNPLVCPVAGVDGSNARLLNSDTGYIMYRMNDYLRDSISNGNKYEQALIRKWWYEEYQAKGLIVWEYYLEGRYQDAVLFPNAAESGIESDGKGAPRRYPLKDQEVILCEAKMELTPELIGQALVYRQFALHAGAVIKECLVFSETAGKSMLTAAIELGLQPVVSHRAA